MENNRLSKFFLFLENNTFFICIRNGLIVLMPFIFVGSFALIIYNFPLDSYLNFIRTFSNGLIYDFFHSVNVATFGFFSVYLTLAISYFYMKDHTRSVVKIIGVMLLSLVAFILFSPDKYDTTKCLQAIVCGIFVPFFSVKLLKIEKLKLRTKSYNSFTIFHNSLELVFIFAIIIFIVAILNTLTNNFLPTFESFMYGLYQKMGINIGSTMLFEFLTHSMWFFGIHGANALQAVVDNLYEPLVGTGIFSKSFLDIFVLIGGSGSGVAMILSILLVSKEKSLRSVAKQAIGPCVFNINELLLFGIPIVFNPILLIPFVLAPIGSLLISYAATAIGIVPIVNQTITWTTPVFVSGYLATNSLAGPLLQLVNVVVGTLIYIPFIKLYERQLKSLTEYKVDKLYSDYVKSKENQEELLVMSFDYAYSATAKALSNEFSEALKNGSFMMNYQPIVDNEGKIVAIEALFRYKRNGKIVNPELLLKLAKEDRFLYDFHLITLRRVLSDKKQYDYQGIISFNVSTDMMKKPSFSLDIINMVNEFGFDPKDFTIEITEEAALNLNTDLVMKIDELAKAGFRFAIDDFAAGSTSLKYVQMGFFSLLKIDGSLTKNVRTGEVSKNIISSIAFLAKKSNFSLLCEYVETKEDFQVLKKLGVNYYQGYYFSKALPMNELIEFKKTNE